MKKASLITVIFTALLLAALLSGCTLWENHFHSKPKTGNDVPEVGVESTEPAVPIPGGSTEPQQHGRTTQSPASTRPADPYADDPKTSTLSSDRADTDVLVFFNGVLYGRSFRVIDWAGGSDPIGIVDSLIPTEYVPILHGATNAGEFLNATVHPGGQDAIVLDTGTAGVLFEALEQR